MNSGHHRVLLRGGERDWIKGVLILFVIADHNDYFRVALDFLFRPLTFHVAGFFLLAYFANQGKEHFGRADLADRAFRYGIPFIIFYCLYAAAYFGPKLIGGGVEPAEYAINFLSGMVIGSFDAVKKGCGGAFMWFLPALLGYTVVEYFIRRLPARVLPALAVFPVSVFLMGGLVPEAFKAYVPFGLLPALYLLPLLWLCGFAIRRVPDGNAARGRVALLAGIVACTSFVGLIVLRRNIEIGAMDVPSLIEPVALIGVMLNVISSLTFIWAVTPSMALLLPILCILGRHSLVVYLAHPVMLQISYRILDGMLGRPASDLKYVTWGILATCTAAFGSVLASLLLERTQWLRRIITPYGRKEFLMLRPTP